MKTVLHNMKLMYHTKYYINLMHFTSQRENVSSGHRLQTHPKTELDLQRA